MIGMTLLAQEAFVICQGWRLIEDRVRVPPPHVVGQTIAIRSGRFQFNRQHPARMTQVMLTVCQRLQMLGKPLAFKLSDIENFNGIVATAVIDRQKRDYVPDEDEYRYTYVLRDVKVLPRPIPHRAEMGEWFRLSDYMESRIRRELRDAECGRTETPTERPASEGD